MSIISTGYGDFRIIDADSVISRSLSLYGEWAQNEIDILVNFIQTGFVVVDAGAFIGTHARAFSAIVGKSGRVIAFEPRQDIAEVLNQNARLAPVNNITVIRGALGAAESRLTVPILDLESSHNFGASTLAALDDDGDDSKEIVSVRPLDDYLLERLDFLKIDVEGMELAVLEGARQTIRRCQPVIFAESNSLAASAPIFEWCAQEKYRVFGVLSSAYNQGNFAGNQVNIFGSSMEAGLLLIPMTSYASFENVLAKNNLPPLETVDDLALLLLHKPQYLLDVLAHCSAGVRLSLTYPSPLGALLAQNTEYANILERLKATAHAKEIAERMAYERQAELAAIRGSIFWRVGEKLRLVPENKAKADG